ncbi:TPA: hypothetical protein QDC59_000211 [Burkholderia cenocepacia]|nr:hypothetical protein [Burkholderia cenocepacia]
MPRKLDPICDSFSADVTKALELSSAAELVRIAAPAGSQGRRQFNYNKLEAIYELTYLRIFALWERFLEDTFHRLLCGYTTGGNVIVMAPNQNRALTLAAAGQQVLNGRQYVLWHNPDVVINRSKAFFISAPHEFVTSSALASIKQLADLRHHIAHATPDTLQKYHQATMTLAGARYRNSVGRFLRTMTVDPVTNVQVRWLHVLVDQLVSLSQQYK